MIWIVVAVVTGLAALGAMVIVLPVVEMEHSRWWLIALAVVAIVGTVGCVKSVIAAGRQMGSTGCDSFADQTGYEVRYLVTTWADGGTCYVLFGGNWVPKGQLWAELGGRS